MKRSLQLYLIMLPLMVACTLTSCNSDDTWGDDPQDYSGTAVTGFYLKANSEVLHNLDSIYFSIDLMNARIFNAQPLPVGTDVTALAVNISSDACSVAQLSYIDDEDQQQTVDYLANNDVKINFAHGPVTFHIESADGSAQRDYKILVSVATEKADSLYWDQLQSGSLKGISQMAKSKAVKVGDKALILSANTNGQVAISTFIPAEKTGGGQWQNALTTPTFDVNHVVNNVVVESFTATANGDLYLLTADGALFVSNDNGLNFRKVDDGWLSITAPYADAILGIKSDGNSHIYASYPSTLLPTSTTVSPDFPVNGMSGPASLSTIWASQPQVVVTGGITLGGQPTGATWSFDGSRWAKISDKLPARSGYAMSRYIICETDTTSWRITSREVLLAFGGIDPLAEEAEADKTVYISRDMGVNWQEGSELLQLPDYLPFSSGGSLLVFDKTLNANNIRPMVVTPITTWQCPYLYLFGGYGLDGTINDTYWSGVVNHLKVKPLQ